MKVSIIIPTYNDEKTITETLDSVVSQTYDDYEVIIVDDGSTDNTSVVIKNYVDKLETKEKIKYIFQENKDQLNAILNGLEYVSGEYIFILHSDDLIFDEKSIENCVRYMELHLDVDSIISDLTIINESGKITGVQKVRNYKQNEYLLPTQLLWLGRNLFVDVGFHRKNSYLKYNKENYLTWNTPFWIDLKNMKTLNVENVDFCFYKYRVFNENYINSENGKINVLSGELRTAVELMKHYYIPNYKLQYFLFRALNKLKLEYKPKYKLQEEKHKAEIIEFIIQKRIGNEYIQNIYLDSLVKFYKTKNDREIQLKQKIEEVYYGKDIRVFTKKLLSNQLENGYYELFKEMKNGFKIIRVNDDNEKNLMEDVCKFLCIDVKIIKKEN